MRVYTELKYQWNGAEYAIVSSTSYEYNGPVELLCGATDMQKRIGGEQEALMQNIAAQGASIFGDASSVFNDLFSTFAPTVAAGPNQRGFSDAERANLNTQATEGTGRAYEHASKAVNENMAARGGGNALIPSGADEQLRSQVATSAAEHESDQKLGIEQADYATGRDNYYRATAGLAGATGVFNPVTGFDNAAVNAGSAASNTANEIAQADNSWVDAVVGGLSGVASAAVTGGFGMAGKKKP